MNCPTCKTALESDRYGDGGLATKRCPTCEGVWTSFDDYHRWVLEKESMLSEPTAIDGEMPANGGNHGRICPACGHILTRYQVFVGSDFAIKKCSGCNSFWFDRSEWEYLQNHPIIYSLRFVALPTWQTRIKEIESEIALENRLESKWGAEDYDTVRRFKAWLDEHEQRSMILAYLEGKPENGNE